MAEIPEWWATEGTSEHQQLALGCAGRKAQCGYGRRWGLPMCEHPLPSAPGLATPPHHPGQ